MSNQLISVPFHNESLTAVLVDDVPYISMKVICDNIGLQWKPQLKRIQRHPVLSKGVSIIRTPLFYNQNLTTPHNLVYAFRAATQLAVGIDNLFVQGTVAMCHLVYGFFYVLSFMVDVIGGSIACRFLDAVYQPITSAAPKLDNFER